MISVITITGIGDHLRAEWPITFTGMRSRVDCDASTIVTDAHRQRGLETPAQLDHEAN
ncbi:MAG: hypothetical protein WB611_32070 [Stellaceae bacterium]